MNKGNEGVLPEKSLGQSYWNDRWKNREMGWDIGYASPAITAYMAQYPHKTAAILIPGCGNAYEAEYLVVNGFTNITVMDIAPAAVAALQEKFAAIPGVRILCEDFFQHEGNYDLIIEQTFFCAISPQQRNDYVKKAASLLKKNGKIIGVLFDTVFEKQGPPFGGTVAEYKSVFSTCFEIKKMEACYNSIPPRSGAEVFIVLAGK